MIDFISGTIVDKNPTHVVVQTNGLGYYLRISVNTYEMLPATGQNVNLKTYLHVREDSIQLYAFAQEKERMVFSSLITISGVGPKLAQTILSGIKVDEFIQAIRMGDVQRLTTVSGVGTKTAQRLIIELKEKFKQTGIIKEDQDQAFSRIMLSTIEEEAVMALLSLGYKRAIVEKAITKVRDSGNSDSVERLIKEVLRVI
jgi:Holliday junction DNA helicase RuvA